MYKQKEIIKRTRVARACVASVRRGYLVTSIPVGVFLFVAGSNNGFDASSRFREFQQKYSPPPVFKAQLEWRW